MNEYMKPDYEVMVFEANEYVAACPWVPGTDLTLGCNLGKGTNVKISTQYSSDIMPGNVKAWNVNYHAEDGSTGSGWIAPIYSKNQSANNDGYYMEDEFTFTGQYGFSGIISNGHDTGNQSGEYTSWYPDNGAGSNNSPYYLAFDYKPSDGSTGFQWLTNQAFHLVTSILNKNNS